MKLEENNIKCDSDKNMERNRQLVHPRRKTLLHEVPRRKKNRMVHAGQKARAHAG